MLPLFISGVLFAGLMLVNKGYIPAERWYNREEYRKFQQQREQWFRDGWRLYQ